MKNLIFIAIAGFSLVYLLSCNNGDASPPRHKDIKIKIVDYLSYRATNVESCILELAKLTLLQSPEQQLFIGQLKHQSGIDLYVIFPQPSIHDHRISVDLMYWRSQVMRGNASDVISISCPNKLIKIVSENVLGVEKVPRNNIKIKAGDTYLYGDVISVDVDSLVGCNVSIRLRDEFEHSAQVVDMQASLANSGIKCLDDVK